MIDPVIIGWMAQWYANVPTESNLVVELPPGAMFPVSHIPVLLVEVCVTPSLFFQVTVVPFGTLKLEGEKEVYTMATVYWFELGAGFPPYRVEVSSLHAQNDRVAAAATANTYR